MIRIHAWLGRVSLVELWSALAAIGWAYWLYCIRDLAGNPNYTVATRLLDGNVWGAVLLGIGCLQMLTLLMPWRGLRITMAFVAGWVWLLLGLSFVMSGNGAPSFVLYVALGGANIHAAVRTACRAMVRG